MAFDRDGKLYVAAFSDNRIVKVDPATGNNLQWVNLPKGRAAESLAFDRQGNFYVGSACATAPCPADDSAPLFEFDAAGALLQRWDGLRKDGRAVDWIELASDQRTIFYTSEGRRVFRFDTRTGRQLPDFATLPGDGMAYALRLLPGGGLLVADDVDIKRLDARGKVVKTYGIPSSQRPGWFALTLDPDGKSFWSGDATRHIVARFDLDSGALVTWFKTAAGVGGIAVAGEPVLAAAPVAARNKFMEEFMDTTKVVATFALLAFMVERLTNGLALLLSYSKRWRASFDGTAEFDAAKREAMDRNRRVLLFFLGAVIAVIGALAAKLELLAAFGIALAPIADRIVSGLLIASGADPIREILQKRAEMRRDESRPAPPMQITGTLILQQPGPPAPPAVPQIAEH